MGNKAGRSDEKFSAKIDKIFIPVILLYHTHDS